MFNLDVVKEDAKDAIEEFKIISRKSWDNCNIPELNKKLKQTKLASYSIAVTATLLIFRMLQLFFLENTVSITLNTAIILLMLLGYQESGYRNMLRIYIYMRKKDE